MKVLSPRSLLLLFLLIIISVIGTSSWAAVPIQLASAPDLSPDGGQLAFSWRGDIWTVPIGGGTARQLTADPANDDQPKYSPDGKRLAFISDRDGSRQVYLMPAAGGEPERLTYHTEGYSLEEWFPDGQTILVSATRDHFWRHGERFFSISTKPRSGEKPLFDGFGSAGRLSPDGKRLLFVREGTRWWRKGYVGSQAGQVWQYEFATGKFRSIVRDPHGSRHPLWHPDGKSFYYVSGQSGSFNLWQRQLGSAKETQLTEFPDDSVTMACIARNGSVIVFRHLFDFYSFRPGKDKNPQRLVINYNGDVARAPLIRRTLRSATDVSFSKDGLEVAFIAGGDVWVMDTELREPVQITDTAEEERQVLFAPDGSSILFASDSGEQCDIWKATRDQADVYWWQNKTFTLKKLTNDPETETQLSWSPTGEQIAFVKSRGDFWVMRPDGKGARRVFESWNAPSYDWSPDGKWLVYSQSNNDFNSDIFIAPLDARREPFNLSMHPDNDYGPSWSPDGMMIAFTGRHIGEETDIFYVYLKAAKSEEGSRDRKLEKAVEKMKKGRKKPPASAAKPAPTSKAGTEKSAAGKKEEPAKKKDEGESKQAAAKPAAAKPAAPKIKPVEIDFEGLRDRIRRVSIPNSRESGLFWSHDSKKLAFTASINAKPGTYTISPPESTTPKLLSSSTGMGPRWLSTGNQILWLSKGVPGTLSGTTGQSTSYTFSVRQSIDVGTRFETTFMQCWREMRDNFYDHRHNNRNWDAIYRKYATMAKQAVDGRALSDVVNMMLGELNGSHLGFYYMSRGRRSSVPTSTSSTGVWRETTAHLGLRFDPRHKGPGLKVRDVILDGPADKAKSHIEAGETVLSIDGTVVDPAMDLTVVLNGPLDRDITLKVRDAKGKERTVVLRPYTYGQARSALYEMWIRHNQDLVEKASNGKLGYLHIRGMDMTSFYRFEQELYKVGFEKDGLLIDVRENGGGSTTDRLLTALTQPVHAITVPRGGGRGYPHDRQVYATWHKPITVLCNQNSFSNAEIFSHSIKTLKRGHVVGVTTSGSVISTGGTGIMDTGYLRLPFRGWFLLNGKDMELNGAEPHYVVWPLPAELPAGKDRQLQKAISVLQADVKKWQQRPSPKLETASELRASK